MRRHRAAVDFREPNESPPPPPLPPRVFRPPPLNAVVGKQRRVAYPKLNHAL